MGNRSKDTNSRGPQKGSFGAKKYAVLIDRSSVEKEVLEIRGKRSPVLVKKVEHIETPRLVGIKRPNRGRRRGVSIGRRGSRTVKISHKAITRQVQKNDAEKKSGFIQRIKTAFQRKGA